MNHVQARMGILLRRVSIIQYITSRGQEKTVLHIAQKHAVGKHLNFPEERDGLCNNLKLRWERTLGASSCKETKVESFKESSIFTNKRNKNLEPRHPKTWGMYCKYLNVCTYRKHFEDLQPIRGPAFFGFVDWQREVYISGILREKQHKEDSPKDRNKHIMSYFLYCTFLGKIINSVGSCFSFSCLCLTGTPEGQSQSISQTASEGANQWQTTGTYPIPVEREKRPSSQPQCKQPWHSKKWC